MKDTIFKLESELTEEERNYPEVDPICLHSSLGIPSDVEENNDDV